ncbi:MAG: hypothetical protein C0603_05910 [Denitrovibrio sp.]|nr:MAG: hypothetical protein C0603_05910 [Denitrovibrio sp.]
MESVQATGEYDGRIKNLKEVQDLAQLIEFILPYVLAKVYMTGNRRWSFLDKDRRKIALALLMNRIIRRFAFNVWDVKTSNGGFIEDFHTMPIIGIIDVLATQYAIQEKYISKESNFALATFKLCGEGIISASLKARIDRLHILKARREKNLTPLSKKNSNKPSIYTIAVETLYELEESLITASKKNRV